MGNFPKHAKISKDDNLSYSAEHLVEGDKILSYDLATRIFSEEPIGFVGSVFVNGYILIYTDKGTLCTAIDQPVYAVNPLTGYASWASAFPALTLKNYLMNVDLLQEDSQLFHLRGYANVSLVEYIDDDREFISIEDVGSQHNFFANGFLVHNKGGGGGETAADKEAAHQAARAKQEYEDYQRYYQPAALAMLNSAKISPQDRYQSIIDFAIPQLDQAYENTEASTERFTKGLGLDNTLDSSIENQLQRDRISTEIGLRANLKQSTNDQYLADLADQINIGRGISTQASSFDSSILQGASSISQYNQISNQAQQSQNQALLSGSSALAGGLTQYFKPTSTTNFSSGIGGGSLTLGGSASPYQAPAGLTLGGSASPYQAPAGLTLGGEYFGNF